MVVGIGQVQEAAGSILLSITTRSGAPCSLTGRPRATVRLSNGRVVGTALQSQPVPTASPGVVRVGDVAVSRVQPAYVLFSSGVGCRIADNGPPFYVEITIWLAGQQRRITTMPTSDGHIGALRIPAQCPPLTETPYYQFNPAPR
jgi:hypothetical protein